MVTTNKQATHMHETRNNRTKLFECTVMKRKIGLCFDLGPFFNALETA